MASYTALLSCDGPIRTGLTHGFRLDIANHPVEVQARTWVQQEGEGWLYRGLRLLVRFEADDPELAARIAETAGDRTLDLLSLAAASEAPPFRLQAMYMQPDTSADVLHVNRFLYDLSLPTAKLRKAYVSHLDPVLSGIVARSEKATKRLMRGLRWYRRALGQTDDIDRFLMLWIAVESLERLLVDHWDLDRNLRTCRQCDEPLVCAKCGEEQGKEQHAIGVARLLAELPDGDEDTAKECSYLRAKIVHAFEDLSTVNEQARELGPILEDAFPKGVGLLLGLDERKRESLARPPLETASPYEAAVYVRLERESSGRFGPPGAFPYLDAEVEPHVVFGDRGEPKGARYSADIVAHTADGVSVEYMSGWVPTRFGYSVPIEEADCSTSVSEPWLGEEAKGVFLWAERDEDPHYPEAMRTP